MLDFKVERSFQTKKNKVAVYLHHRRKAASIGRQNVYLADRKPSSSQMHSSHHCKYWVGNEIRETYFILLTGER